MVNEKCRLHGEANTQRMSVFENFFTYGVQVLDAYYTYWPHMYKLDKRTTYH
jgi:hypothetical protein